MPSPVTTDLIARTEQRIAELEAGKEVDVKHINFLLSKERQKQFDTEWKRQQSLRKIKKPSALNTYETLHKQTAAILARCLSSASRSKAEQATLIKLQTKCVIAIENTHAEIVKQIKKRATLLEWLDREVTDIEIFELDSSNQKSVKQNNSLLNENYERLPILVSSKNERRRVTQEERFGWQTKREIRLRLLRETLTELNTNLVVELDKEQKKREVRAARVFMDANVTAKKNDKNAMSQANAALQRNGFRRLDVQYSRGMNKRDVLVRDLEEALLKRFEADLSSEEREQLEMSRQYDKQTGKVGK